MTNAHSDDSLWFVQFSVDEVRALGLDELDAAFQAGTIDEATLVREDGSTTWMTLGAMLAGEEAPEAAPEPAPNSVAPPSAAPPPVVAELDLAEDMPSFGASRKRAAVLGAVAVVGVLGAVAFTAVRMTSSGSMPDASKVAASIGGAAGPAQGATPTEPALAPDAGTRFNDEQRRLLLEADKKREAEAAARASKSVRSGSNAPSRPIKIGDPISKGGSKYDPLNGQL